MPLPVVGIIGNSYMIDGQYPVHATGKMNSMAVARASRATPLIIASDPDISSVKELLGVCDGFLMTGGRPNVHPEEYGAQATVAHGTFDRERDRISLQLIRACVARGQPVFGVCRGFQEFNVAFGGSLHPEIRDLPGRMNHRMPLKGTLHDKFALRHSVKFTPQSAFIDIFGADEVVVNSLHGQGILDKGERISVEGYAPDGTAEALTVSGCEGFAMAVQWHPEYRATEDPVSRALFAAFGTALLRWQARDNSSRMYGVA